MVRRTPEGLRALWYITVAAVAMTAAFVSAGCAGGGESGRLETRTLDRTELGREMELAVLRAPEVEGVDSSELPVFVLLHGMGDDHLSLDEHGLSGWLHESMVNGDTPLAHFVLPDGEDGYFANWYDGSQRWEDYVVNDVIPAAEAELGVDVPRERRHIIGVSMGGQAALRIGLKYPNLFASASSLSSLVLTRDEAQEMLDSALTRWFTDLDDAFGDGSDPAFSDSHNAYMLVESRPENLEQRIFLAAGEREWSKFQETSSRFAAHLDEIGVPHQLVIYDGGHGWEDWRPVIVQAMSYAVASR